MFALLPSPLAFWHEHIGRHISDQGMNASAGALVDFHTKNGVKKCRIGTCGPTYFFASERRSFLLCDALVDGRIGPVELVGKRTASKRPTAYLSQYLLGLPDDFGYFMVGAIGKSNPVSSFHISTHVADAVFCERSASRSNFMVNLRRARQAVAVATRNNYPVLNRAVNDVEVALDFPEEGSKRLLAHEKKTPGIVEEAKEFYQLARPRSGEWLIARWALSAS
jgi:hypothetical protein